MISSANSLGRATSSRAGCPAAATSRPSRKVAICRASSATATAWDSWSTYMKKRTAVKQPAAEELKLFSAIGSSISKSAGSYKPRFGASTQSMDQQGHAFKQVHVTKTPVVPLSADLHAKLEAVGVSQLKQALHLSADTPLDAATTSFTTTDVNAGICITGCIIQKGSEKSAVVALVATETERQASWSRLEGLLLHWAVSEAAGGAWSMPPAGWAAMPSKNSDNGRAVDSAFDKFTLPGTQQQAYTLVLTLPLSGVLRSGGVQFVVKAADGQNTKWLKDASTDKDFFVDLQSLPFARV